MPRNRTAETLYWAFGAAASVWFIISIVFRLGGDARPDYFLAGLAGAALFWGSGWVLWAVLSGRLGLWFPAVAYAQAPALIGRTGRDQLRPTRGVKNRGKRAKRAGNSRRGRRD
jgi:hypothetical protein